MLEDYTIPALTLWFFTGLVIGINVGMICSRSDDSIPSYVFRRENLPIRYPGDGQRTTSAPYENFASRGMEPSGKRRMASQFNY